MCDIAIKQNPFSMQGRFQVLFISEIDCCKFSRVLSKLVLVLLIENLLRVILNSEQIENAT